MNLFPVITEIEAFAIVRRMNQNAPTTKQERCQVVEYIAAHPDTPLKSKLEEISDDADFNSHSHQQ